VDPRNNDEYEDCEGRDVKAKKVNNVLHKSSGVKVCDYVYNLIGGKRELYRDAQNLED
tara:strand:+ start:546 stop:719 length:174 start_codon:yes stop_codon:yes gene_type:complete